MRSSCGSSASSVFESSDGPERHVCGDIGPGYIGVGGATLAPKFTFSLGPPGLGSAGVMSPG